jgi:hypothetical protein
MATTTRQRLRERAQLRADMENTNFISSTEWNDIINTSYRELYDILVGTYADYYSSSATFTLAGGSGGNTYSLPADFYKLRGLDYYIGSGTNPWREVPRYNFEDRNKLWFRSYARMGSVIRVLPEAHAGGDYKIWYIPQPTALTDDAHTVEGVNGWEEYIVIDAAIKALNKEESDVSALMAEKAAILKRVESMASESDANRPATVADIYRAEFDFSARS